MGMIISAINRAINEMDIKAIKELKISWAIGGRIILVP